MQERRRYVRLNIPLEVSYVIEGRKARQKSITQNISPSGARFSIGEELSKGTILDIEVKIPIKSEPVPIKARIVWARKGSQESKGTYDAGFEFIHIPEESKRIFFQYLCNLMFDQLKKI